MASCPDQASSWLRFPWASAPAAKRSAAPVVAADIMPRPTVAYARPGSPAWLSHDPGAPAALGRVGQAAG
jgi:hypothetical protein